MENNSRTILEGLNREQKLAVSQIEGPVLIVAGAGSGKTRVLTSRIAYILAGGGDPSRILALTFTKKAASEMKERIAMMVGERAARRLCMGTFHSVFIRFLREYADSLGYPQTFTIYDKGDSESAVKACLKELQLDDKVYKPREVLSRISMAKNNLVTAEAYGRNQTAIANDAAAKKPKIYEIYRLYAQKCRQAGVMDFDDILLNMNILLRDNPEAARAVASRFDYIMVDEYQDTNFSQYVILRKLAAPHNNICVVGDDSQSIYAFRGAKIQNILDFKKDYPDSRTFRLEQNYRSTKVIVDAANSLIAHNSARIEKKCFSEGEEGEQIRLIQAYTEQEEALLIASAITAKMRSDHAQYQDFAILYRTNSQSRALEEALRRRNMPYMIYSGNSFFERAEVKDVMAYFKLAANPADDESFKRVVNKPARGIGDTSMSALIAASVEKRIPLMKAAFCEDLENYGLKAAAIKKIRDFALMMSGFSSRVVNEDAHSVAVSLAADTGIYIMYKQDTSIEGQAKAANVEELLNGVKTFVEERHGEDFEQMQVDGDVEEGVELSAADLPVVTLADYLENVSLLSAADTAEGEDGEDVNNKISLMTVHSSKGLEFPYVFVAGMEENLFPSGGSLASAQDVEEERRLFYVAMTRAKKCLQLTFASSRMRNGKHENNSPSRFIREIDTRYISNPLQVKDSEVAAPGESSFGFRRQSERSYQSERPYSSDRSYQGDRFRQGGASSSNFTVRQTPASSRPGSSMSGSSRPVSSMSSSSRPVSSMSGSPRPAASIPAADFVPSPILELRAGQRVEHNRFGLGKILQITGRTPADLKAVIEFDNFGQKILLLNYAKIRIVR